ncbi:hypothetical protein B0H14DRAFT_2613746 [Mycena olivaceomarginata]|nr:hypothetical protein B0H14DRAFT_2613746 [Mycena olivaceomarginata]
MSDRFKQCSSEDLDFVSLPRLIELTRTYFWEATEEKHALPGDETAREKEQHAPSTNEKERKGEQGKDWGQRKSTHSLEMRRQGKRPGGKGKDKKARESERGKDRGQRKSTHILETRRQGQATEESTHFLETRRQGKVSEARTGNKWKACISQRREGEGKDEKARESERGKDGQQRKTMHFLETRRQGKVSEARTGTEEKHALPRDKKARENEELGMCPNLMQGADGHSHSLLNL